jgi:hypothetical protein
LACAAQVSLHVNVRHFKLKLAKDSSLFLEVMMYSVRHHCEEASCAREIKNHSIEVELGRLSSDFATPRVEND